MHFFLAHLYSDRLSGASAPAMERTTPVATLAANDDAPLTEVALVGSH